MVLLQSVGYLCCDANENIAWKVSFRSFSLYYDFPYTLRLSNAGEPSWSSIPMEHIQVSKEKLDFRRCLFTCIFSIKREIGPFSRRSNANTAKKCTKKVRCTFKVVVLLIINLLLFWRSRCRRVVGYLSPYLYLTRTFPLHCPIDAEDDPGYRYAIRLDNFL